MTDEELTDEELVKALRDTYDLVKLWPEKRPDGFTDLLVLRNLVPDTADRIEALTEQLEAARADAKEAEAYAEGLERDIKTCCMAQVVMDNTVAELERERDYTEGTNEVLRGENQRLEAKLAKAVEALRAVAQHEASIFFGLDAEKNRRASWRGVMRKVKVELAEIEGEKR
jgi:chromosome segregation ATPase